MTTPAITGSISHGTLRSQDLGVAFLTTLQILDPAAAATLDLVALGIDWDSDEGAELLDSLEEAINETLPEGWHFGAHEGDGSDLGIWQEDRVEFDVDSDQAMAWIVEDERDLFGQF